MTNTPQRKRGEKDPRGVVSPIEVVVLKVKYQCYLEGAVRSYFHGLVPSLEKYLCFRSPSFCHKVGRDLQDVIVLVYVQIRPHAFAANPVILLGGRVRG